ncbi:MAG: hypothetical protein ACKVS5_06290 [Parvularculaceae bacterium]
MTGVPFDNLKAAIRDYGQAAFENLFKCRALGDAIVTGFHAYEGCPKDNVAGVPAEGPFDPHKDYGDAAFSFAAREIIILEPVRFGLSLIVGNAEDKGALWLRTVIAAEIAGDHFDVFVASRPVIRVPHDFEAKLGPVFEAIHAEFLETFTLETNDFLDARFKGGIGFLKA